MYDILVIQIFYYKFMNTLFENYFPMFCIHVMMLYYSGYF